MLIALLLARFRATERRIMLPERTNPANLGSALDAIGRKLAAGSASTLSTSESRLWNTAVVISYLSSALRDHVPGNARVLSWSAARAGFKDMGLPAAAEFVTSLVTELAFRSDLDPRDRRGETASLLRLAALKGQFSAIEEAYDLKDMLGQMLKRASR